MAKIGRPRAERPRSEQYRLRMTDEDEKKLEYCAKETGLTKAEVLRMGLDLVYEQIVKK